MSGAVLGQVVINGQIQLQHCSLYLHECAILQDHHLCPESWWRAAGKPVQTPLVSLCPNCHMNVHAAIDGLVRGQNVAQLPARCVRLAQQAFHLAIENGLTPAPTL